jgi:hypothetical protein
MVLFSFEFPSIQIGGIDGDCVFAVQDSCGVVGYVGNDLDHVSEVSL